MTKRYVVQVAAHNLGLLMRVRYGLRKPRGLVGGVFALIVDLWQWLRSLGATMREFWCDRRCIESSNPTRVMLAA